MGFFHYELLILELLIFQLLISLRHETCIFRLKFSDPAWPFFEQLGKELLLR